MDIRKVKKLIELLEESNVAEIEIHEGEESVRISRMPAQAVVQAAPAVAMAAPVAAAATGGGAACTMACACITSGVQLIRTDSSPS